MTTRRCSAGFLLALVIGLSACGAAQQAGATSDAGSSEAPGSSETPEADAQLTFTPEADASATETVTLEDGGTITATASDGTSFELEVPAEAVAGNVDITLTPLSDVGGIDADSAHAVLLEPGGLEFYEPVRLTITPDEPIPVEDQLAFEASGDGADPALALVDPSSEAIVILLDHFSVAGIATASEAQRARMLEKSAANAEARLIGQVNAHIGAERINQLVGGDDEAAGTLPREELEAIAAEYKREVLDKRKEAAEESCRARKDYVLSVIRWEQRLQMAGMTEAEEAASLSRVAEALQYAQSRYDECEKEAIEACQEADDSQILVDFWLWIDSPVNKKRAEELCEPQALQFEMHGSGASEAQGNVTWDFWAIKCEGRDDWMVWEDLVTSEAGSTRTGPPDAAPYGPVIVIFTPDGVIADASWPGAGEADPLSQAPPGWGSFTGTDFTLTPPDDPIEVHAAIPGGFSDSAPVEPYDGTFGECESEPQP